MAYRVMPSPDIRYQTITTNGRIYSGTPGQVLDVPEADGLILSGNGWALVGLSGPTSARPTGRGAGTAFFDTTLGAIVMFDGATWRDPATGNLA